MRKPKVVFPTQHHDGMPDPPSGTFGTENAIYRGTTVAWMPPTPDAGLLAVMHAAYVEVANEHHQERLKRVYAALRKEIARRAGIIEAKWTAK